MPLVLRPIEPQEPVEGNIFEEGFAWLANQMIEFASVTATYYRGTSSVICQVLLGNQLLKLDDGSGGFRMEMTDLDVLVRPADLDFGGGPITPQRGDRVVVPIRGIEQTFRVMPYGGESCWRYDSGYQTMIRIHTKLVGLEPT